jgi:hypothetical protein
MSTTVGIERPFTEMAERIARIAGEEFAGAVVIVPPGDSEPIAFVTSDPRPDLIQFLAAVKARVEIAFSEAQEATQPGQAGGWRGR